jgi:hypothetical protein
MPAACVFCGSTTKITREHIVAEWIGDLFRHLGKGTAGIIQRDGTVTSYQTELFGQRVKVVCFDCNSGWMSRLEGRVKGKLGPILRHGQATRLSLGDQKLLATWAVKTAFMFEHLHPNERIIPDSEYGRFYSLQQPPPGYVVWMAHRRTLVDHTGRELLVASRHEGIHKIDVPPEFVQQVEKWMAEGRRAFIITFSIGRVVFQVFGHDVPGAFRVNMSNPRVNHWIWPVQGDVTWPPALSVEDIGGLFALHQAHNTRPPTDTGN